MKALKSLALSLILVAGLSVQAFAGLPWGSTAPLEVSGTTPTCTYTSTALACIENMTGNVTSVTLAGITSGLYSDLIHAGRHRIAHADPGRDDSRRRAARSLQRFLRLRIPIPIG